MSLSGWISVADKSVQLPTGSATMMSAGPQGPGVNMASVKPLKLQKKQLPLTSETTPLMLPRKAVSTKGEDWS